MNTKRKIYFAALVLVALFLTRFSIIHAEHKIRAITLSGIFLLTSFYIIWACLSRRFHDYRNSKVVLYIKTHGWFLTVLLLVSAVLTFISYPGILYSDSYDRINMAFSMESIVQHALSKTGNGISWAYNPIPSLIMSICLAFTDNIALYTMVQAFTLMLSISLFIEMLVSKTSQKVLAILVFICSPLVLCASTYYEAGVGCTAGMLFLIVAISHVELDNSLDRYVQILSIVASSVIAFGYRINAITMIPVAVLGIWLCYRFNRKLRIRILVAALSGCLLVPSFANWANIETTMSSAEAFSWELVTAIGNLPDDRKVKYMTYLDDIAGEHATSKSIQVNSPNNICPVILGEGTVTRKALQAEGAQSTVIKKYLAFACNEPVQFLKTKWQFISATMGISRPLSAAEWDYDRNGQMASYHFNDSPMRHTFHEAYLKFIDHFSFLLHPWIIFLSVLALLLLNGKFTAESLHVKRMEWIAYFTAVFYYGAFLINTQSIEFRYFYPSCLLLLLLGVCLALKLLNQFASKKAPGACVEK